MLELETFLEYRNALVAIAHRVTGTGADAEDVVQEVWFKWAACHHEVRSPRAWLAQVTTRAAIDRSRRLKARREVAWDLVPEEPASEASDPAAAASLHLATRTAARMVLERLSPLERIVFVLHDGLDYTYNDIAIVLGRTEPAVRQLSRRARLHVHDPGRAAPVRRPQVEAVVAGLNAAAMGCGLSRLLLALSPASGETRQVFAGDEGGRVGPAGAARVSGTVTRSAAARSRTPRRQLRPHGEDLLPRGTPALR